jgi:hypothetical protein
VIHHHMRVKMDGLPQRAGVLNGNLHPHHRGHYV